MNTTTLNEAEWATTLASKIGLFKICGTKWRTYNNGVWQTSTRDMHRPLVYQLLPKELQKAKHEAALLNHLEGRYQTDDSIFRGAIAFEDDAILVNVRGKVICVTPTEITARNPSSDFYFTRCLDIEYDADATCPTFLSTLQQSLPDEQDRSLLQICVGNFLYPDCRYEVCLVWYGEAGCGKSTLAEPFVAIFGDGDNGLMTKLTLKQMCDPRSYSLPKLRYACVNLGTELDSLALDESTNFKTITSGESFEAREIYDKPFSIQSHCKPWFLANCIPRFKSGTDAEQRRMRFLRFQFKPEQPDVTLKSRLNSERQGVFNYMLKGLQTLMTLSAIPYGGEQSRLVHDRFKVGNDPLQSFLAERCTFDASKWTLKDDIYAAYQEFAESYSLFLWDKQQFCKHLYERHTEIKEIKPRDSGKQVKAIGGLVLKPN